MTGLVVADRVQETTATTGTGTLNLAGASTAYRTFVAGVGTGNSTYYEALSGNGTDWETGIGLVTSGSPDTLTRAIILSSSNAGAAISLTGTSIVFGTGPAALLTGPPKVFPPLLTNWTQRGISGTAAAVDSPVGISISDKFQSGPILRAITRAAPSTPYTIDAIFALDMPYTNFASVGIGFTDATKYQVIMCGYSNSLAFRVINYNSVTSFNAAATADQAWFFNPTACFLRIADDGTNVTFLHSPDGVNFNLRYSVAKSSGFLGGSGYTNVCFFIDMEGTAPSGTDLLSSGTLMSWYVH
jgi:hypothetical protein